MSGRCRQQQRWHLHSAQVHWARHRAHCLTQEPLQQQRRQRFSCAASRTATSDVSSNVDMQEPSAEEQAQMDADAAEVAAALAAVYESAAPDEEELEPIHAQDAAAGSAAPAEVGKQKGAKVQRVSRRSRAGAPLDKELPIEMLPKVDAAMQLTYT
jgi:hypothetical protein